MNKMTKSNLNFNTIVFTYNFKGKKKKHFYRRRYYETVVCTKKNRIDT